MISRTVRLRRRCQRVSSRTAGSRLTAREQGAISARGQHRLSGVDGRRRGRRGQDAQAGVLVQVTYAGTAAFVWWTMHFLQAGRVPWRRLLPAAVLTAVLRIGLGLFSAVYFSSAIISDSRLYGTIGVVFTLLTWFIAIGAVIVLGAVGGATWNQHKRRPRGGEA